MNKITSASDYEFSSDIPHTDAYLAPPILKFLQAIKAKRVLDIGCGNGTLAKGLADMGIEVVGIDPSASGIENAQKLVPSGKFYCMGIYDDPKTIVEEDFDAVVSSEVVEHVFYPREFVKFAAAKVRSGGSFLVTTPYHGYLKNLVLAIFDKWDSHHTVFWDGGHIKFWSRATLSRLLREGGFEVVQFIGCGRLPYLWKSMLIIAKRR